ncbi:thymidine kinase [Paenibacillus sp. NEAU-GSW1]|uniref:thymidine kinase n=1 Tax=Paenibacillus sp. NEAU-GSW1 TaxID=2682486 RepID=UPI00139B03DE|nr:thymidine kinase [Paenibacillus sp. NEAU-GSW1]
MERGIVTVITGPMFSEKSGELIRRCQKLAQFGRMKVAAYKPAEDYRFGQAEIVSRIGYRLPAASISRELPEDQIRKVLKETEEADVVAFDEVQFFAEPIFELISALAAGGKQVITAGLNMDYRGKPFGSIGQLLAVADEIVKLSAFCAVCGSPSANFTQRVINGQPAEAGPVILIGDTESYEPRCRCCFSPPKQAAGEQ